MSGEQFLLLPELDPESDEPKEHSGETAKTIFCQCSSQAHHQKAGVNGMPHEAIRAALDQFMALFEDHVAVPVSRQRPPRPNRSRNPDDAKCRAQPRKNRLRKRQ